MSGRKIIVGLLLVALGLLLLSRTMARKRSEEQAAQALDSTLPPPDYRVPQPIRPHDSPRRSHVVPPVPPPGATDTGSTARISASPDTGPSGRSRYTKFIGDIFVDCSGVELQNLEVSSFIGDIEVKLHGGRLARGLNRMIISGFIGDVRILVPEGMAVFTQSSNFIGDMELMGKRSSGIGNSLDAQTTDYSAAESKLYIASNHFIGDVRVYVV